MDYFAHLDLHWLYFKTVKEIKDKMHAFQTFIEHGISFLEHFHVMFEVKHKFVNLLNFIPVLPF